MITEDNMKQHVHYFTLLDYRIVFSAYSWTSNVSVQIDEYF